MATLTADLTAASPQLTASQRTAREVAAYLRSRSPLIWIVSREERRVEVALLDACQEAQYAPILWDCAAGLTVPGGAPYGQGTQAADVGAALAACAASRVRQAWILRDLPTWLRDPNVLRAARNLVNSLPSTPRPEGRALIVISPSAEIPPELAGDATVIEWPLPDRSETAAILAGLLAAMPEAARAQAAPAGVLDAAADAAVGLTGAEARACYAQSLITTKRDAGVARIDPATVAAEKRRVISRERVLEWVDVPAGGLANVGGLAGLRSWLAQRRAAFSPAARAYGLPAPKGVLLVGPPGTGKSLSAKAIAGAWGMPLLRLDLGALQSKWVGESQSNIRKALRVAESISPCVLWVDEIEKALAGATQGAADGGVSSDALGTLLSWMQDKAGSVFLIATANDVSALPPELLRKGRFDELFFVDLPTAAERVEILTVALRGAKRTLPAAQLTRVAAATDGFSGAELAALVPAALYRAYADDAREITAGDLAAEAGLTAPLSRTAGGKLAALREWAVGRTRPAGGAPVATSTSAGTAGALDL